MPLSFSKEAQLTPPDIDKLHAELASTRKRAEKAERERNALWRAIIPPGPQCHDCADFDGRCQGDGHPCDPQEDALERVAQMRAAIEGR